MPELSADGSGARGNGDSGARIQGGAEQLCGDIDDRDDALFPAGAIAHFVWRRQLDDEVADMLELGRHAAAIASVAPSGIVRGAWFSLSFAKPAAC